MPGILSVGKLQSPSATSAGVKDKDMAQDFEEDEKENANPNLKASANADNPADLAVSNDASKKKLPL